MRNLFRAWAIGSLLLCSQSGATEPEQKQASVQEKVAALAEHLRSTTPTGAYGVDAYFAEMVEIGKAAKADTELMQRLEKGSKTFEETMIVLAVALQDPLERKRVDELKDWYGRLEQDLPFELISDFEKAHPGVQLSIAEMEKMAAKSFPTEGLSASE